MRHGWNPDQRKWKDLLGEITDLQWKHVPLKKTSFGAVPPTVGVYIMMISIAKIAGLPQDLTPWNKVVGPMYIGLATNLQQRFSQHANKTQKNTKELITNFAPIDFWWTECGLDRYQSLEAMLIELFGPPFNSVQPFSGRLGEAQKIR